MNIDDKPLGFGKWATVTPRQLYDRGEHGYLIWLYENIGYQIITDDLYEQAIEAKDNGSEEYWKL